MRRIELLAFALLSSLFLSSSCISGMLEQALNKVHVPVDPFKETNSGARTASMCFEGIELQRKDPAIGLSYDFARRCFRWHSAYMTDNRDSVIIDVIFNSAFTESQLDYLFQRVSNAQDMVFPSGYSINNIWLSLEIKIPYELISAGKTINGLDYEATVYLSWQYSPPENVSIPDSIKGEQFLGLPMTKGTISIRSVIPDYAKMTTMENISSDPMTYTSKKIVHSGFQLSGNFTFSGHWPGTIVFPDYQVTSGTFDTIVYQTNLALAENLYFGDHDIE